ncbi:MAG TPA: hypothetical protein VK472_00870 [Allosphingosinicella sp.]|nr:hypothetical protein [Allosphingosinicella sp.]
MRIRHIFLIAALAAAAATTASAQEQPAGPVDHIDTARILFAAEPPTGAQSKSPGKELLSQGIFYAGDASFDLPLEEARALRERLGMEHRAPLFLAHRLHRDSEGVASHQEWLFCAINTRMFKSQAIDCFRDSDGDRRFEALAQFEAKNLPLALPFAPIDPIPYKLSMTAGMEKPPIERNMGSLSIKYRLDEVSGHLLVRAEARTMLIPGLNDTYALEPDIDVDPAKLPAEVELAGAKLRLLAWDGKKLSYEVERPMTRQPILLDPPGGEHKLKILGKIKGYTLRIVEAPPPAD